MLTSVALCIEKVRNVQVFSSGGAKTNLGDPYAEQSTDCVLLQDTPTVYIMHSMTLILPRHHLDQHKIISADNAQIFYTLFVVTVYKDLLLSELRQSFTTEDVSLL